MARKTRAEVKRKRLANAESTNRINAMRANPIEYVGLSENGIKKLHLLENLQKARETSKSEV